MTKTLSFGIAAIIILLVLYFILGYTTTGAFESTELTSSSDSYISYIDEHSLAQNALRAETAYMFE